MPKEPLTKNLQFEKKNKDMVKLPKHARIQKRPIPHPPIASPYAGSSIPKTVYVSTSSPFMAAVKRVQKLLRQAEKRATASVDLANARKRNQQRLAMVGPRAGEEQGPEGEGQKGKGKGKEEVFVKATGRAMEKALAVGKWFEEKGGEEFAVRVSTGSVLVVDDVEEEEGEKRGVVSEGERGEDDAATGVDAGPSTTESTGRKEGGKKNKRKRTADPAAAAEDAELPETRTRWVNMVEVAVSLK
ncbi:ribonuclease P subunit p20 family protein [Aspergillus candidus]|uniref:Rpp20 subunit of nuclear RNase MRP and P-domain-containing protein n=1 Tax=Aspergillus candidus TaxID=41067 RepID=A0A2I2FJW7_ASPCN|nr:Rpp20 subunit of nuclear RNase MRP and P-domain-containing protein [Aspergillus candidus]PLB40902.1 Rpp20 subunit of nuclear RNase MRP and P-domain-containing protein [Aspergillus candidus]